MKTLFNISFEIRCAAAMTAVLLALAASDATAATYTWTQTAGGAQNWTTGGNWDGGSAPTTTASDTVDFSTVDILDTTLALGANRTANTWKFGDISGAQTWTVSGNTLILAGSGAGIEVGTATSISSVLSVSNGTTATATGSGALTLTNSSFSLGGTTTDTTQTLDLRDLAGGFAYNNSSGTFRVAGTSGTTSGNSSGTLYLAPTSTITATTFGVGNSSGNANSGTAPRLNSGTVYLGSTATTINADTITLGAGKAQGTVQYASGGGATNPELTLRGADGTSRVTTMIIGTHDKDANDTTNTWDLTSNVSGTSQLDAMIGTLTVGEDARTSTNATSASVTGNFLMGGGTLDATTIVLGKTSSGTRMLNTTGTFTTGAGGTVKVGTLTIGDKNSTENKTVTATFNLNGGADLHATTIQAGNTEANGTVNRTFNWNDGTIHNLAGADLTIGTGVTWNLAAAGTRTFDIDDGRIGTVNADLGGAGGLIKDGAGILTLAGANTYTGGTEVQAGTLNVTGSLSDTGAVTVLDGASITGTGTINSSLTFNENSMLDLTGATIGETSSGILTVAADQWITLNNFALSGITGWDWLNAGVGTYTLINGGSGVILDGTTPTEGSPYDFGNGKQGYFQEGSLQLVVIPEPATLSMIGVIGIAMLLRRRIVRG